MEGLKDAIKRESFALGFDKIGFSEAEDVISTERDFFNQWLDRKFNGDMTYLERNFEKRMSPSLIFPEVKTIISLATNYYSGKFIHPLFSRYVTNRDYHKVIRKRLRKLTRWLTERNEGIQTRFFVDSAPVLEKYWAQKAGLGWIGKNTCFITKEFGSWVFLSEIFINVEIEPDACHEDCCGRCSRCIEACPNNAILKPGLLDAKRCISYLTIEKRTELNENEEHLLKNYVFGCDICQNVCPWNQNTPVKNDPELAPMEKIRDISTDYLLRMDEDAFNSFFRGTAVKRVPYRVFKKNLEKILSSQYLPHSLPD
jgi:epoxyqueuosine reductase